MEEEFNINIDAKDGKLFIGFDDFTDLTDFPNSSTSFPDNNINFEELEELVRIMKNQQRAKKLERILK